MTRVIISLDYEMELEKRRRGEDELIPILKLLNDMDKEVVDVIEKKYFSQQNYGEFLLEKITSVKDFSEFLCQEEKKKLERILWRHKPEMIGQLKDKGFSFEGSYAGA